jgi:hypothetical protein
LPCDRRSIVLTIQRNLSWYRRLHRIKSQTDRFSVSPQGTLLISVADNYSQQPFLFLQAALLTSSLTTNRQANGSNRHAVATHSPASRQIGLLAVTCGLLNAYVENVVEPSTKRV